MKISTGLDYSGDVKSAAERLAGYEAAGLDVIWVAEAYGFDCVSLMGYLAAITDRVTIASGILPIYTRTPTLLAQTAAGLDNLTGGRFALGLGASGPQVIEGWHGVPYDAPISRTREIIEICRSVWAREGALDHQGPNYRIPLPADEGTGLGKALKIINHPLRSEIPIYVASLGPKNVELTAELAHGWLPVFFHPERAASVWGGPLAAGTARRSPDLPPLDVVAGGLLAIGDDATSVRDLARPMAALYIGGMGAKGKNFYNTLVARYGFEAEAEQIQDLYLAGQKSEAAALVPDELLEATTLCGPEGYVREQIAAYREAGVTNLMVTPIGDDPVRLIGTLRELVD